MSVVASLPQILSDIGMAIVVAAALAFVARALKQPLILAYVAAGVVLGPLVTSKVTSPDSVEAIASLGLVLLLYLIGLEIDVQALRRAGKAVLLAGALQLPLNLAVCLVVPWLLSATGLLGPLGPYGVLYLSFALSLSSTLVVVKVLYDKSELDTLPGRITLGVLVLQDLWAIVFLAAQPNLSQPEVGPLAKSLALGAGIVVGAFAAARYVLPPLFKGVARSPEALLLGALAWCFLVAGSASMAGLSAEMGALVAGLSLSYLPYKPDIVAKVATVRDFFLTLFFVSLGLKVAAPTVALAAATVGIAAFVLVSRYVVMFPLLRALKVGDRAGIVVSTNLWPVSEFSLVLTAIGLKLGHVEPAVMNVVLFAMILSAVLGIYWIGASHRIYAKAEAWLAKKGWAREAKGPADDGAKARREHAIVLLGFHRIASALLYALERARPDLVKSVLVVDFNPVALRELERRGVSAAYGDLSNPDTLHHVGMEGARVVVCTIPDTLFKGTNNLRLLANVQRLAPEAKVIATAETSAVEQALLAAGAVAVLVPQRAAGESALADVLAILEGRVPPSAVAAAEIRTEVLP